jgi:hypothetical protein
MTIFLLLVIIIFVAIGLIMLFISFCSPAPLVSPFPPFTYSYCTNAPVRHHLLHAPCASLTLAINAYRHFTPPTPHSNFNPIDDSFFFFYLQFSCHFIEKRQFCCIAFHECSRLYFLFSFLVFRRPALARKSAQRSDQMHARPGSKIYMIVYQHHCVFNYISAQASKVEYFQVEYCQYSFLILLVSCFCFLLITSFSDSLSLFFADQLSYGKELQQHSKYGTLQQSLARVCSLFVPPTLFVLPICRRKLASIDEAIYGASSLARPGP